MKKSITFRNSESRLPQVNFFVVADIPAHISSQLMVVKELVLAEERVSILMNLQALCDLWKSEKLPYCLQEKVSLWLSGQSRFRLSHWALRKSLEGQLGSRVTQVLANTILRKSWIAVSCNSSSKCPDYFSVSGDPKDIVIGRMAQICSNDQRKAVVVYPEINYFYNHLSIYGPMRKRGAFQIILPYSLVNEEEWRLAFSQHEAKTKNTLGNLLVDKVFPAWIRVVDGKKVRIPLVHALSALRNGYKTYNPWLAGAVVDVPILAPDKFAYDYLLESGYDQAQLSIIGMLGGGRLAQERIDRLTQRSKPDTPKRFLVAVPPNQLPHSDESLYLDIVLNRILMPISMLPSVDLSVSLHPRSSKGLREAIEKKGITIQDKNVDLAISTTDVFVACASATLRIGESLGVSCINYDVYNYGYKDYVNAKNIVTVNSQPEYEQAITRRVTEDASGAIDITIKRDALGNIVRLSRAFFDQGATSVE